jgi:hypothetical protein
MTEATPPKVETPKPETIIELVTDYRQVWLALGLGLAIGAGLLLLYLAWEPETPLLARGDEPTE